MPLTQCVFQYVVSDEMNKEGGVARISAGHAHTLAVTKAGNVWVFGCGLFGQLGNGSNKKSTLPVRVEFSSAIDGRGLPDPIDLIACGYFHNYALSTDRQRLYTWGCNPQLLRIEAQQKKRERMECMKRAESEEGGEGSKEEAQTEDGREMLHLIPSLLDMSAVEGTIEAVACGNQHTIILTALGEVYTFGRNVDGQLGES